MKMGDNFVNFADFEDNDELTNCRRLAKEIVKNVIDKAREEVARKSTKISSKRPASLELNNLTPSIQIDLVPSRSPSPEIEDHVLIEQQQQQTNKNKKRKIRIKIIEEEDENELAEEEKASKEASLKKKQEESINKSETKKSNSTTPKKKSSVSWGSDENEDRKVTKTEPNSINSIKNIEQKINDNQFSNEVKKKTNSIKFDSSNENKLINNKNDKLPNNIDKKSCKFTEEENSINWPNYNNDEINKVASNFVQQLVEDAKIEADKRIKPSTSRTSALYIEDKSIKEGRSIWSLGRIREILSRIMRSSCLCKKSSVTQSNTSGSIAEYV